MDSRKLPVLRILLFPPAALLAYSAFCYYREQYEDAQQKKEQSIKALMHLHKKSENAQTIRQLLDSYNQINKLSNKLVTDPSLRVQKVLNSQADIVGQQGFWSTRYRMDKLLQNNHFNFQRVIKKGLFSVGFWTNLNETNLHQIGDDTQKFYRIIMKVYKARDRRCGQIAQAYGSGLRREYNEVMKECIEQTAQSRAKLARELDMMQKMEQYQASL